MWLIVIANCLTLGVPPSGIGFKMFGNEKLDMLIDKKRVLRQHYFDRIQTKWKNRPSFGPVNTNIFELKSLLQAVWRMRNVEYKSIIMCAERTKRAISRRRVINICSQMSRHYRRTRVGAMTVEMLAFPRLQFPQPGTQQERLILPGDASSVVMK